MPAQYLIRFDDLCPTTNWSVWDRVEAMLDETGVRPIVAVVPDNEDPGLVAGQYAPDFWDRVRGWQSRGWVIALHGHRHVYETRAAGLVGLRARSEFAGLPSRQQADKLDAALAVFAREGVRADAWVAPGHSFDRTTLMLLREREVNVVSDGFHARIARDGDGMTWVPQQLWRFAPRPAGVWTVCYHVNSWSVGDIERFGHDVQAYRRRIGVFSGMVAADNPPLNPLDATVATFVRTSIVSRHRATTVVATALKAARRWRT